MSVKKNTFLILGNYHKGHHDEAPSVSMQVSAIHRVINERLRIKREWHANVENANKPEYDPSIRVGQPVTIDFFTSDPKKFGAEGGEKQLRSFARGAYLIRDVNIRNISDYDKTQYITTVDACSDESIDKSLRVIKVDLTSLCSNAVVEFSH